jgi:type VI secretion system (T6SS) VasI/EvfG family protein
VAANKNTGCGCFTIVLGLAFLGWCSSQFNRTPSTPSQTSTTRNLPARATVPARAPKPEVAPAPEVPPAGGKWIEAQDTSEMDDSKGVSFYLPAENEIDGWLEKKRPGLTVRCHEKTTYVYMVTGMSASVESGDLEGHTVRIRFDDAPAQRQRWRDSTDDKALFAPNAVQMARNISKSKTMRAQFTPFNAKPVIATFDVSGFEEHIGKVAAACRWRP